MLAKMLKYYFKIITSCGYNVEKAQRGIVYIDEVDKISKKQKIHRLLEMCQERGSASFVEDNGRNYCKCSPQGGRKHPQQEFYK